MTEQPSSQRKILIVDDEAPLAQILSDKFVQEGFAVKQAGDGQQGLALALDWHPDMILLDIIMPKMDGMTMLHQLRTQEAGKKIPVILLTNLSDTDKIYDAMANGVFDFLVKANWSIDDIVREVKAKLAPVK